MKNTKLLLKQIPSIPNLKAAVGVSSSGDKLLVFSSSKNSFQIASIDDSLEAFGGITVVGPGVSARPIDPTLWLKSWLQFKGLKFGGEGWGLPGSSCKLSVTFTKDSRGITSVQAHWICIPTE
ncbi:MAG: hypothetical protein WBM04_09975 [Candidatus Korobacteraceae bacterium]